MPPDGVECCGSVMRLDENTLNDAPLAELVDERGNKSATDAYDERASGSEWKEFELERDGGVEWWDKCFASDACTADSIA